MKLTGKCKEEFEKWFDKQDFRTDWDRSDFEDMSISMQYGVIVDFFDSVDIHIDAICIDNNDGAWYYSAWVGHEEAGPFYTRQEARTEARRKANELYLKKYG